MTPKRSRASSMSSSSTPDKRSKITSTSSPSTKKRKGKEQRSIWNTPDDWDQLVADSGLSTSSISLRRARPRGSGGRPTASLVDCAAGAAARAFKVLWEEGGEGLKVDGEVIVAAGKEWKSHWAWVADHLKEKVRNGVFKWWGSVLKLELLAEVFSVPPTLYLPGDLLPDITKAQSFKAFDNLSANEFTTLILTHATKATDTAFARRIHLMPHLQVINFKGCLSVGSGTIREIIKTCPDVRRLNLKGTSVGEGDVKALLDTFGKQLECLKVDEVDFDNVHPGPTKQEGEGAVENAQRSASTTFSHHPYERMTHLCLPGDVINNSSKSKSKSERARKRRLDTFSIGHPTPRPAPPDATFDWSRFSTIFPALTHLYLPSLLIPAGTIIDLVPHTLVKFSLGQGGPPVPITTLIHLVETQYQSLTSLDLGHIQPVVTGGHLHKQHFVDLGTALGKCKRLETFRLRTALQGSQNTLCDLAMKMGSEMIVGPGLAGPWRHSLKRLALICPGEISSLLFLPNPHPAANPNLSLGDDNSNSNSINDPPPTPPLEELHLPSANLTDATLFARALSAYGQLRDLDLSGTTIEEEDMRIILDGCPLLSRVDLTSCRGVSVVHRRNIFKAFEETSSGPAPAPAPA